MENFDIVKYLRENHLGSHAILGNYVDLHALKEEDSTPKEKVALPKEGIFKDKGVAEKVARVYTTRGLKGVEVKKVGKEDANTWKIYVDPGQESMYEADYGNNQPVDEVPYGDGEGRLDGFGNEFDQVAPVEEIQMAGENPWLNDSIDGEMIGDWTAYFAGQMGTIYLVHPLLKDLTVYATPGWEGEEGIAIAVVEDDVDRPWKNGIVPGSTNSYETFEEYAADMQSVLKDIENAYMDNSVTGDPGWEYTDKDFPIAEEEGMNDDDSENPFPSIIDDKTANMSHDDKFAYMGGKQIKTAIKSLMDDNFDAREIAQFVVDTIRSFKK